jgi:hypothetical protein
LAVLLAFQPVADGKNSRRPKLETGHSANDVNAVEALCYRRCRILFFQKNPSPPSGSQVPSPCSRPGIDYVSLAKGAMSPQPAGRAAKARPWAGGRNRRRIREAIKGLMRSLGYRVEAAASAQEFLSSRHIRRTSCLIVDMQMPG